ncbi:hypothetical protein [Streptosporangium sp. LJ11]|uniref:hypothetical protein n=1 Tax=Streptosporangium sp. LJ11 TaxID=3436927 RepID=UPI003F79F867
MADTRVTLVTGARQCGKSTPVRLLAKGRAGEWRNLDTLAVRQAALTDPADFVVGIVLCTGTQTLPFGDRMRAMPVSALWEVAAPCG